MIISLNWLKQFVDLEGLNLDEVVLAIGQQLVEVESVVDLAAKYQGALVVEAKLVEAIEGSDHLRRVLIDDAGVCRQDDVVRTAEGWIELVCGADNIAAGQKVVWLPPQTIVPETFNSNEPFKLSARKIFGVISHGMIASRRELDFGDEHQGILVLEAEAPTGQTLIDYYQLNDYLLEIDNKSLTNRPDCFGIIGFAREVAAILDRSFKPFELMSATNLFAKEDAGFKLKITDSELCPKYQLASLVNVKEFGGLDRISLSYLERSGVRSVSSLVDATNYVMLLTGQPLHAFDYDKVMQICQSQGLSGVEIGVRLAKKGENLRLLDGREIKLSTEDIVITAGAMPIALAGAMGGLSTAIDHTTERILLESATFNLYNLRTTQMRHGIFSEAVTRFTKGQPPVMTDVALALTIDQILAVAGASNQIEVATFAAKTKPIIVKLKLSRLNQYLDLDFSLKKVTKLLARTGFVVSSNGADELSTEVPAWRMDVRQAEDVIEEVGRLVGYQNLQRSLPSRPMTAILPKSIDALRLSLRRQLAALGANEVLTYSFVDSKLLGRVGQPVDNSYRIVNSISPRLEYYRQSLLPSLVDLVHKNIKAGFYDLALFEVNKVHQKAWGLSEDGVPNEMLNLGLVVAKRNSKQSQFFLAKRYLEELLETDGIDWRVEPASLKELKDSGLAYGKSAVIKVADGVLGLVGEFAPEVIKQFKLPVGTAGFEVNLDFWQRLTGSKIAQSGLQLGRFPAAERDVCWQVESQVSYQKIASELAKNKDQLTKKQIEFKFKLKDIYQAKDSPLVKNLTFEFSWQNLNKTLSGTEVDKLVAGLNRQMAKMFGAKQI